MSAPVLFGNISLAERILCLDADSDTLIVVEEFLRGESFACDTTTSAEVALDSLRHNRYALLMTEIHLPTTSGITLMKQAHAIDETLACVITAAMMDINDALEAMRAGASDFLVKPFHLGDLLFTIDKSLERRRLLIENRRHQIHLEQQVREATTELECANQELRRTKDYLENVLDSSADTVLTINTECRITFANRAVTEMLGYEPADLAGKPLALLLRGGDQEIQQIRSLLLQGPVRNYETEMIHLKESHIPTMLSLSHVHDPGGRQATLLAICRDVTQQKQLENELKEMTIKDNLTSLYNQRYFYERLEVEIERAKRQNHPLSLLLFDVDHFKEYNDTHGHLEGDRVLQAIGEVVRECTRDYVDIGCRYGGDEFTIILPETDQAHARQIAERIRASFESRRFGACTVSVGLMTYRKDSTAQSFIRFADEMMYDAKRSGGNRVYVYDPENNRVRLEHESETNG